MGRLRALSLLVVALLSGCVNLGPDYERPEVALPETYIGEQVSNAALADLKWWELFNDPVLQELISLSLEENRDLRAAVARVNEARARLGISFADQFPQLNGSGSASRRELGQIFGENNGIPSPGIIETYNLSLSASYEVDFWGRFRRATEAARGELLATEEAQRTVLVTLIADVATNYLLLRDLDARVMISQDTLEARQESTRIVRAKFDKGTVPLLDVNQAEIQEAEAMATLASLRRQTREVENLLSVLVGSSPRTILRGRELAAQMFPVQVPAGLPAELLERRPDIRAAEQRLAAQTARIGVAKALRFPSITLTAAGGYASDDLSDLVESDSQIWSVGVDILGPIFDAGKRRSQVEAELARTEAALNDYEQTVLEAMRDVEDALAGIRYYRDEFQARAMQVKAAESYSELSRARYDGGITDYLEVLDSDRSLFEAQLAASSINRLELVSIVRLYRALGGGWLAPEVLLADPEAASAAQTSN